MYTSIQARGLAEARAHTWRVVDPPLPLARNYVRVTRTKCVIGFGIVRVESTFPCSAVILRVGKGIMAMHN